MNRTTRIVGSAAAVALVTAGLSGLVPASAKGSGAVVSRATCSQGHTVAKLAAKARDGRIEIEAEVDSNRNGQVWTYAVRHDTTLVTSGRRTTLAPSGSFTVRTSTRNAAGVHRMSATARNTRTGETCSVAVRI